MTHKLIKTENYLLVVDDNKDIEENMWTVKEGKVREVSYLGQDNGYAIIAHLPLNGSPILEGVDLLPPIEDDVEKLAKKEIEYNKHNKHFIYEMIVDSGINGFIKGYNKAREKYRLTLSKLIDLYVNETGYGMDMWSKEEDETMSTIAKIIQPLHQYPTEFECEMESVRQPPPSRGFSVVPITVISAEGVEWVGKYK